MTPVASTRKILYNRLTTNAAWKALLADDLDRIAFGLIPQTDFLTVAAEKPFFLIGLVPGAETWQNTGDSRAGKCQLLCQACAKTDSILEAPTGFGSLDAISEAAQELLQSYRAVQDDINVMFSVVGEHQDTYEIDNDVFQAVGFYLDAWIGRTA